MGSLYGRYGSYALGLALLAVVAVGALLLTVTVGPQGGARGPDPAALTCGARAVTFTPAHGRRLRPVGPQ